MWLGPYFLLPEPEHWGYQGPGDQEGARLDYHVYIWLFSSQRKRKEERGERGRMREKGRERERETDCVHLMAEGDTLYQVSHSLFICVSNSSCTLIFWTRVYTMGPSLHPVHTADATKKLLLEELPLTPPLPCGLCDSGYWGNCPLTTWRFLSGREEEVKVKSFGPNWPGPES